MLWYSKPLSLRRVKYWLLLVLLGTIANTTIIDLPFVVPFCIGNIALFLIMLRLGVWWAVPASCLILLPLYQNLAFFTSLLQLALLLCFNRYIRQYALAAVLLYAFGCGLLFYFQAAAKISDDLWYLILHIGLSTAVFAFCLRAMLILETLTNTKTHGHESLSTQLSHRVAMYSSIPSTLLIAVVLHGTTALDLSRNLLRYQSEQHQLAEQIGQRLTGYMTQVMLAADMLELATPSEVLPVLTQQRPEFISALTTDAEGNVNAFYKADLPESARTGSLVADRPYFIEPKRTGEPFVSDTFQGRNLGQDQLFAVSVPLKNAAGSFDGVMEVSVNLNALTKAIKTTDTDISHRVLLDREQKKIWGTNDNRPLGQVWSVSSLSGPGARSYLPYSWFNSIGPILVTQNAAHLLLLNYVTPGQWQLKYFIDTAAFIHRYHLFLALALLMALLLLETITALSRAFVSRYTVALEQLAHHAAAWQPDDSPQPRPMFQQSAEEIETLANTLSAMQHRVRASRQAMQHSMAQIVTMNNELEQRVQIRTEELIQERDKANQLASIKTRFLANMSHEIRTPITVIKGFTEQLISKINAENLPLVSRIQQNTEHLQRLVDDILDTAKIDEGKMRLELQAVPLKKFTEDLTDSISALATQKQLSLITRFDLTDDVMVTADPFRLKQILLNLLSNAIKFTAKGQITLKVTTATDGDIDISVIDQGIGITPEQQKLLFSAFSQADSSTSRHFGGTGLGLYISRQLADAMQMQLSVSSEPGVGSTFSLRLPLSLQQVTAAPAAQAVSGTEVIQLATAQILVVDDVADIRALIASYLEQQPLTLYFAADGKAAIEICRQHSFDLILMDQQMPELDGFHAAQQLREMGLTCPIILLSADVFEEPHRAQNTVFNLAMTKPFSKQQLLAAIAALQENGMQYPDEHSAQIAGDSQTIQPENDELLQEYRQSLPAFADNISLLLEQQQLEKLARLLHQLKGTSACFGLMDISASAQNALQAIKSTPADLAAIRLLQTQLRGVDD
jgi:signal transduction histidine kinase/DNA-binding response OmpR family regulator